VFYAVVARVVLPAMMNLLSTRSALYGSIVNIELVLHELDQTTAQHTPVVRIRSVPAKRAAFTLKGVTFAHSSDAGPVLNEVSLEIEHPSWVAVVGRSGAGKSTLLELLCGIHQPQGGEVLHYWPTDSGPRVAYLPQHVALLDGSILDNVSFGLDAGDRARARQVLELACLTQVVERLPGGLDARIGAEGGRLSGGERQRLALARALYRQPDLLLLDEATSGLDEPTEHRLLERLRAARPDMTVVYITHRDANLRFADRVVRVAGARVQDDAGGAHL
ncbi:ATP-binding cassette domain-containing protein, partial [Pseudomonas sp.]|uniref:ATP-binding cassette domain-containing protein n=1 Tax=Pseudomonas sp. TaxID=306 RepID=UPI00272CA6E4